MAHSPSALLNLGTLWRASVIIRPSTVIKSPYVADVLRGDAFADDITGDGKGVSLRDGNPFAVLHSYNALDNKKSLAERKKKLLGIATQLLEKNEGKLAHAPSLDCGGMLVSGACAYMQENLGRSTKTEFTIQLCEEERGGDEEKVVVGYHPRLAERAAKEMLEEGSLEKELGAYTRIASQRTFGNSRVDFVLESDADHSLTLVEVKNVVGAEYLEGTVPKKRSPVGVYTVTEAELPTGKKSGGRHAIFPHGSVKRGIGVVSDRAIKHVVELGHLNGKVDEASGRTIKTAILFVINRSDTSAFRPCHEACMLFAKTLKRAQSQGTQLIAKEVVWKLSKPDSDGAIATAEAWSGKTLPVNFHSSVNEDVDEEHLGRVLKYNAEVPKTRSPPPKGKKAKATPVTPPSASEGTVF